MSTKDTCTEICGDGFKYNSIITYCDDGNTIDSDGCTSSCTKEVGWNCSGGDSTNKDVCTEICGDGMKFNSKSTYCDDQNVTNGDGCDMNCNVEVGWSCLGGTSSVKDTCSEICGDGIRFNSVSTYCDDGNLLNGDGCDSNCLIETGWSCSGGDSLNKDSCSEICGDGKKFNSSTAYCDDGNILNNDGCDSLCRTESGYICTGGSSTTQDSCTEICGDGIKFNTISSYCDDGNISNNDGCNSSCNIESGWSCSGGTSTTKDICSEICGDGKKFNSNSSYCDDGNTNNSDGCDSSCNVESGCSCSGGTSTSKDACNEICGDGIRFNSNSVYCDDGNTINGDGCSSSCIIEDGWSCSGGTTSIKDSCSDICGDGKKLDSSSGFCDDGNVLDGDGCSSNCQIEIGFSCFLYQILTSKCSSNCGNGIYEPMSNEQCDDENLINNDGCSNICEIEPGFDCVINKNLDGICLFVCGNGINESLNLEQCDNGNNNSGDGCSSTCEIESGYSCTILTDQHDISYCTIPCGNGKIDSGEECDDGNFVNGDGCDNICQKEDGYECITVILFVIITQKITLLNFLDRERMTTVNKT